MAAETTTPQPPEDCPQYLREGLQKQSAALLRAIATYAEALAEHKEAQAERELQAEAEADADEPPEEWDDEEWEDALKDIEAPAKATRTTKTIKGHQYYYLQWREGDTVKSEYVAPVSPSE